MVPRGLEPRTLRLLAVRSSQLSYETVRARNRARRGSSRAQSGIPHLGLAKAKGGVVQLELARG